MNKELLKGNIDLLILSIVKEKESYGCEISKTIKENTEGEFEIQEAALYLSLTGVIVASTIRSVAGAIVLYGIGLVIDVNRVGKIIEKWEVF